jgi:hypothetical protein
MEKKEFGYHDACIYYFTDNHGRLCGNLCLFTGIFMIINQIGVDLIRRWISDPNPSMSALYILLPGVVLLVSTFMGLFGFLGWLSHVLSKKFEIERTLGKFAILALWMLILIAISALRFTLVFYEKYTVDGVFTFYFVYYVIALSFSVVILIGHVVGFWGRNDRLARKDEDSREKELIFVDEEKKIVSIAINKGTIIIPFEWFAPIQARISSMDKCSLNVYLQNPQTRALYYETYTFDSVEDAEIVEYKINHI